MKSAPAGLIALLATGQFVDADLYTLTLTSGTVLYYTTAETDVSYGGHVYSSRWIFPDSAGNRSTLHAKTGLAVDQWVVEMMPAAADPFTGAAYPATIMGQPWLAAVTAGVLEGALVQIDRAYWAAFPAAGVYPWVPSYVLAAEFVGWVGPAVVMRDKAVLTINSVLDRPAVLSPPNLFQPGCIHTLFDAGCTLSQAAFAIACTVSALGTQNSFTGSIAAPPGGSGSFVLGQIAWSTGANAGFRFGLRNYTVTDASHGRFDLIAPAKFAIQIGDTFSAYPGCDKTFATCGLFANQVNFGGTDTIPAPETAV